MEILFYFVMFLIGIYFGSFFTLAVYRIPRNEDILYKHSYCPNCNHKLGILDLVPVFSYLFLGAKCRYCKEKIRPRYFILEIFSGLFFVLFTYSIGLFEMVIGHKNLIYPIIAVLYVSGLIIIAGINKEKNYIEKRVLVYQTLVVIIYSLIQCCMNILDAKIAIIEISILILLYITSLEKIKMRKNTNILDICILMFLIFIFSGIKNFIVTVCFTILCLGVNNIIYFIKNRKKINYIGFYLAVSNIITTIMFSFIQKIFGA